jgi:hypothetical protein
MTDYSYDCHIRQVSFEQAVAETVGRRRHLLLGNGFSRAFSEEFAYASLYERAGRFSAPVQALFDIHQPNFEAVLKAITDQRGDAAPDLVRELDRQEAEVKAAFVKVISDLHPDSAADILGRSEPCAKFLKHFHNPDLPLDLRGKIYSTNYDLLLFWVIARWSKEIKCYDDFVSDPSQRDYRPWGGERKPADLVHLHGALHLYEAGGQLFVLRYKPGARLVDQIRDRLKMNEFPIFVAEGDRQSKSGRIKGHPYLKKMRSEFMGATNDANSVLFTYGHSLDDVDAHLLDPLGGRKLAAVYVGAFGGPGSKDGARAAAWAHRWAVHRAGLNRQPLPVSIFDSRTVEIWGPPLDSSSPED